MLEERRAKEKLDDLGADVEPAGAGRVNRQQRCQQPQRAPLKKTTLRMHPSCQRPA
jgi:hypothetical protein